MVKQIAFAASRVSSDGSSPNQASVARSIRRNYSVGSKQDGELLPVRRSGRVGTNASDMAWAHSSETSVLKGKAFKAVPSSGVMVHFPSSSAVTTSSFMDKVRLRSRRLCESWRFCVLTTALTFCALFGDDFRLAATHKRTDVLFNVLTIVCILVFSVEIVASSLGKDGYFLGFFFVLDIGSTITLLFDLTWVGEELFCESETGGGQGEIRASRAGRAGARASRTVRLIRLIRLVKLYKTYKTTLDSKGSETRNQNEPTSSLAGDGKVPPGFAEDSNLLQYVDVQEEDDDVGPEESDGSEIGGTTVVKETAETRVGKKLSDMTTRRVIGLVLVMLFTMPQFSPNSYQADFPSSAFFGMEIIYGRWREWCYSDGSISSSVFPWCLEIGATSATHQQQESRWWYEKYLLQYIYTHRGGPSAWQLYWVGLDSVALKQTSGGQEYIPQLGQLGQRRFLGEFAIPAAEWDAVFTNADWLVEIDALPDNVKKKLLQPWTERCYSFLGVSVSSAAMEEADQMSGCSITEDMRCTEVESMHPSTRTNEEAFYSNMLFAFDARSSTRLEAALSMLQTIFICLAVGIGAMGFSNDSNKLLLNPIERMIAKMEAIKDNPLEAMKLGDLEYRREERENAKREEQMAKSGKLWSFIQAFRNRRVREPMETMILEKTIIKLGHLLALGFGEAGAEIIGHNMKGGASAGVNAMVPGSKVDAIIGFCNIRNFTDATEVLKEKVMLFVNQVGEIVHGCVDDFHGAPNKNIGDSFLLIWRLSGASSDKQTKLADMSVMSFIRILVAINKSPTLAEYRGHPGLLQRLPHYRVEMGFSLHCGWAIEGAIGSEFKIDASYLSPNVNVAARLQAATTQFGVWILLSHFMVNLCSQVMAKMCRLIDHVTVKGSRLPVRLHTIDLDYMKVKVEVRSMDRVIKNRFKVRQTREVLKNEKWSEEYNVCAAFENDEDLVAMRSTYSKEFFQRYAMAYRNYEAGEWMVARDMFFYCCYDPREDLGSKQVLIGDVDRWPQDGPSATLLRFMKKNHFWPPTDWTGHRELTDK